MKNPESMTSSERLARIRSLERKVRRLEQEKDWAEREGKIHHTWALEQCAEIRRLHVVLEHHWEVRQEALRIAGLPEEQKVIELARFDFETRTWEPAHPELET